MAIYAHIVVVPFVFSAGLIPFPGQGMMESQGKGWFIVMHGVIGLRDDTLGDRPVFDMVLTAYLSVGRDRPHGWKGYRNSVNGLAETHSRLDPGISIWVSG